MQIHKILQYNILDLIHMLVYRTLYKILLTYRKLSNKYMYRDYQKCTNYNSHLPTSLIFIYQKYVVNQKDVVERANKILEGNIFLFENWLKYDYNQDWLKDPKSGKKWNPYIYANDAPFVTNGYADVKYVLEPNKLNPLVTVAQAYYITKDNKYVSFIAKSLKGWMSCVPVERSVANRIVMDIAYRAINLIHISILCWNSDYFHKEVMPFIVGILLHHENYMWSRLGSRWFKSNNDNNHNVGEIVGLYVTQVWLTHLLGYTYKNKQKKELNYLFSVLDKIIAPSGAYIEQSGNYTKVVAEFLVLFDIFNKAWDISNENLFLFDKRKYLVRITNYMKCISYNNILDNFGDNDGALVLIPFEKNTYNFDHISKYVDEKLVDMDFHDASQCVYNSKDENRVHVFTRVGRFAFYVEGAYIHAHNDMLSLLLSLKGSRLFIDKGCYYYNSGLSVRKEYVCLGAHNNVVVDELDLSELMTTGNRNYPSSNLIKFDKSPNSLHFIGLLEYKNVKQIRTIDYLNDEIVVSDEITTSGNKSHNISVSYLLCPSLDAKIDSDVVVLTDSQNGNSFRVSFENLESLAIVDELCYPTYGYAEKTKRIVAKATMDQYVKMTTRIQII